MKFLHAADIHLDSPLTGLRNRADLPPGVIDHFTRRAFRALIDLALAENVAFVVIAGDLYDGDWRDYSTGSFFADEMRRLGMPCFLLRGNHDAQSVITRGLTLPANVRQFSSRKCETFLLESCGVALHGHSFPERAVRDDLLAGYRDPVPGMLNIGVLHTSADDPGEHARYAPCTAAALALKGYDYWALGHIHARRVLSERPWIVFPGNIQGRNAKETGAKGCALVSFEDGQITSVEHHAVDVLRWAAVEVDVTGADYAGALQAMADAVQAAVAEADGRPVFARVTLVGETAAHAELAADTERLVAECRSTIAADAVLWVEQLRVRTRALRVFEMDLLAPVQEAFVAGLDDASLVAELLADLTRLRDELPQGARDGLDVPLDSAALAVMAQEAWDLVARALTQEPPA